MAIFYGDFILDAIAYVNAHNIIEMRIL